MSRNPLHPTSLMLAWIVFAIAIPQFDFAAMLGASVLVGVSVLYCGLPRCWQLLRRTRILLITLLLVYAFMTPGTPLFSTWEQAAPTLEGLNAGLQQIWRLVLMMGALAALLAYLSRQQLLLAIYGLLSPLKPIGLPVQGFAVRLWLTLDYLENIPKSANLAAHWDNALALPQNMEQSISIEVRQFGQPDALFAMVCTLMLGWALW